MSGSAFVDTNVLVYAHDRDAGLKHEVARELVRRLWSERSGVLSLQVLEELYVTVTRKIKRPLRLAAARDLVATYGTWRMVLPGVDTVVEASRLQERHRLSFWDALIVAAALESGAEKLLTEDLHAGRAFGAVRVENPFAPA